MRSEIIQEPRALALRSHDYDAMLNRVVELIDQARRISARSVNALMTATYWFIGRHIVEFEQQGKARAEYGEELLKRMATDLATRFGKGYSLTNLKQFRQFYLAYLPLQKSQTPSDQWQCAISLRVSRSHGLLMSGCSRSPANKRESFTRPSV